MNTDYLPDPEDHSACRVLHDELMGTIRRCAIESDIGFCESLGVLEMVRHELLMLARRDLGVEGDC